MQTKTERERERLKRETEKGEAIQESEPQFKWTPTGGKRLKQVRDVMIINLVILVAASFVSNKVVEDESKEGSRRGLGGLN